MSLVTTLSNRDKNAVDIIISLYMEKFKHLTMFKLSMQGAVSHLDKI